MSQESKQPTGLAHLEEAALADLEALRLLLQGGSVIDWVRAGFQDEAAVRRFLELNEFRLDRPGDRERLDELRGQAVDYLTKSLGYRIPDEVGHRTPIEQLLLIASSKARGQGYACAILKVMHVMHHLAGRELLFKLPISDDQVFGFVESKVVKAIEEIRGAGYPIVEFAWSRKEHDSVVTKLLAKKASLAVQVYDKLRFRLITRGVDDLAPVLHQLLLRLVPFNYVVPGETVNGILPFRRLVEKTAAYARHVDQLQQGLPTEEVEGLGNEFSGPTYRVINFVADLPIRVDQYLGKIPVAEQHDLGATIFVLTEFQVMDAITAQNNEQGDNSHQAYKLRQHQRVKARLTGAGLPKRGANSDDDKS